MNAKAIIVKVDPKISRFDLEKLEPLQGPLKSLSESNFNKLKKSITGPRGFFVPLFLWSNGKTIKILDGHQRVRVLTKLQEEGYGIPKIPAVLIEAKNEKEAKDRLLAITSAYGKIEADGLYEFLQGSDAELIKTDFELPGIDSEKFFAGFFSEDEEPTKEATGSKELSSSRFETFHVKCPKCSFEFDTERKDS